MKLLTMKSQLGSASIPISGGSFFVDFGEYEKVKAAQVTGNFGRVAGIGPGAISGYTINVYPTIVSNNQVQVWVEETNVLGVNTVAASGVTISNTFVITAYGE